MATYKKCITVFCYEFNSFRNISNIVDNKFSSMFNYISSIDEITHQTVFDSRFIVAHATVNPFGVASFLKKILDDVSQTSSNKWFASFPVLLIVSEEFIKKNEDFITSSLNNVKIISENKINQESKDYINSIFSLMSLDYDYANNNPRKYNNDYDEDFYSMNNTKNINKSIANDISFSQQKFDIRLDSKTFRVFMNNIPINFCAINFKILELLIKRKNEVIHRSEIIQKVWPHNSSISERTVDVHIKRIRDKLLVNGGDYRLSLIRTVRNIGYYYISYEDINKTFEEKSRDSISFTKKEPILDKTTNLYT